MWPICYTKYVGIICSRHCDRWNYIGDLEYCATLTIAKYKITCWDYSSSTSISDALRNTVSKEKTKKRKKIEI